jgi:hypothetical protein
MPLYLVERALRELTSDQLRSFGRVETTAAGDLSREGVPVRWLGSTFVPGDKRCFSLFEAVSASAVRKANERAGLPFDRIIEVAHVSAEDVGS